MDNLDHSFLKYLKEIEQCYITFPKALRIRIEKWISKLSSVGQNPVWRKNRNKYAKLLLNMVAIKTLSEPFHTLPPEGPLGPLPVYLQGKRFDGLISHYKSSRSNCSYRYDRSS